MCKKHYESPVGWFNLVVCHADCIQMIHCTEISIKEGISGAHHKNMLNNLGLLSSRRLNSLDMVTLQNFGIGFGLTILTSEIRTKDLRVISLKEWLNESCLIGFQKHLQKITCFSSFPQKIPFD